jgi:hypothetical protein
VVRIQEAYESAEEDEILARDEADGDAGAR